MPQAPPSTSEFPAAVAALAALAQQARVRESGRRDRFLKLAAEWLYRRDAYQRAAKAFPCPAQRRRAEALAKEAHYLAYAWDAAAFRWKARMTEAKRMARAFRALIEGTP